MDHDAEYKLSIQNYSRQPGDRFYSLVAALPHIERVGDQPPTPLRTICYTAAPIPHGGQDAVTIYGTYYAVIGERQNEYDGSGSEIIVWKAEREVRLGRPGASDGSVVEAHCQSGTPSIAPAVMDPDGDARGLPAQLQTMALLEETSPADSFTIRCVDQPRGGHTFVVGVAQRINNDICVLAAVPYTAASEYVIRVRKGFLVTMRRGRVGHVVPDGGGAARNLHPVWFPGYLRALVMAEDQGGHIRPRLVQGTEYPTPLQLDTAPLGWEPTSPEVPVWTKTQPDVDPRRTNTHPSARLGSAKPPPPAPRQPVGPTPLPTPTYAPPPPPSDGDTDNTTGALTEDEDPLNRLREWDTVLLIDDSGSMAGSRWTEAKELLEELVPILTTYDADGIDVYFLNHISKNPADPVNHPGRAKGGYLGQQDADEVEKIFGTIGTPTRRHLTPTGRRLRFILRPYLALYAAARGKDEEDDVRPLSIIIITDGEPSDNLEEEIVHAARELDKLDAPSGQVGLQFFQIGNDPRATDALKSLDDDLTKKHGIRDMVDTVTWGPDRILSADLILNLALGAMVRKIDDRR